jgi:hypothetical protein
MGLDMFLQKSTYVQNWDHNPPEEKFTVTVEQNGKLVEHIKPERVSYIIENVGYWRKANAIHKWFVDNVQDGSDDCKEYHVGKTQLEELLELCKQIKEDNTKAEELLPTQEGFFFGGTEYDEFYFEDIKNTIEMLESLLSEDTGNGFYESDYIYQSSW